MDTKTIGWINGGLGILAFSGSLPATKVAVQAMSPYFLTGARAVIAAGLAAGCLWVFRAARPAARDIRSLIWVALGVVVGFPLLSAMALQHINSVHSIVFTGLLPISTAVCASLLGEKHPPRLFWLFSGLGGACIVIYALTQGFSVSPIGDLLMLAAIAVCGFGYAEGARLSRRLGGWQVICWALVVALPVMLILAVMTRPVDLSIITWPAWVSLGYVSVFSMLIGFVFWYRGLAMGGIAAVGQLQLMQPFLALILAACLLKEPIGGAVIAVMAAIVACVAGARRFAT
ncbi:DMT family transporter [Asticcacaulis sp. 201]|uniref:DMT family transporter n=1 Tax=Asticcacaulis sp. 201 TaxID=3028787 RepID=UPI0029163489|nr:DMT family transporter [Asticcacaulis sp. 201]MDV6333101.1 DMT family transporter [Asticcacaulis sp. 201]